MFEQLSQLVHWCWSDVIDSISSQEGMKFPTGEGWSITWDYFSGSPSYYDIVNVDRYTGDALQNSFHGCYVGRLLGLLLFQKAVSCTMCWWLWISGSHHPVAPVGRHVLNQALKTSFCQQGMQRDFQLEGEGMFGHSRTYSPHVYVLNRQAS